jgi:hypothetical protein
MNAIRGIKELYVHCYVELSQARAESGIHETSCSSGSRHCEYIQNLRMRLLSIFAALLLKM